MFFEETGVEEPVFQKYNCFHYIIVTTYKITSRINRGTDLFWSEDHAAGDSQNKKPLNKSFNQPPGTSTSHRLFLVHWQSRAFTQRYNATVQIGRQDCRSSRSRSFEHGLQWTWHCDHRRSLQSPSCEPVFPQGSLCPGSPLAWNSVTWGMWGCSWCDHQGNRDDCLQISIDLNVIKINLVHIKKSHQCGRCSEVSETKAAVYE